MMKSGHTRAGDRDTSPANRLGLDYRRPPARKTPGPIVDAHTHIRDVEQATPLLDTASLYGVTHVVTMTPLEHVRPLRDAYGERLSFIAIPNWRRQDKNGEFQADWLKRLAEFRTLGAAVCKFWMAPPMRGDYGLTLDHPFFEPIIDRALELGYGFMTHIADPTLWFQPGGRYADAKRYGTKAQQFEQLEWFLERTAPQPVIGAHFGGGIEDLPFLQGLLDRHLSFHIDSSATKWIVRETARQPDAVRAFLLRNQDRVLFGSDLVTAPAFDFEHYASRYWAHQTLWETDYRGESPIEDPDADGPPLLNGVNLPPDVLEKMYFRNARAFCFQV